MLKRKVKKKREGDCKPYPTNQKEMTSRVLKTCAAA